MATAVSGSYVDSGSPRRASRALEPARVSCELAKHAETASYERTTTCAPVTGGTLPPPAAGAVFCALGQRVVAAAAPLPVA